MIKSLNLSLLIAFLLLLSLFCLTGCSDRQYNHESATDRVPESAANDAPDSANVAPVPAAEPGSTEKKDILPAEPVKPNISQPEVPVASDSWYFKRNNIHEAPFVNEKIKNRLHANNAFYYVENDDNRIYLTFDEGYELGYTAQILDILSDNNVKAIFFITGHYLDSSPELVLRMKQEGHLVGNHTVNHPDLGIADTESIRNEIKVLEERFTELTGLPMDKYLRPPMGLYSEASLAAVADLGYKTVFWSMAFNDWDPNNQPGAEYSYQHVIDNIHPGAVILLHAVSESNTEALDRIIKDLKADGYVFSLFF